MHTPTRSTSGDTTASRHRPGHYPALIAAVLLTVTLWWLISAETAMAETKNPFTGVNPNFDVFGPALNSVWKRVLAAVWAACIGYCAFRMLSAGAQIRSAKGRGAYGDVAEGKEQLQGAAWATGCVLCIAPIFAAAISIAGV